MSLLVIFEPIMPNTKIYNIGFCSYNCSFELAARYMAGTKKQSNGWIGPMTLVSWKNRKKDFRIIQKGEIWSRNRKLSLGGICHRNRKLSLAVKFFSDFSTFQGKKVKSS